MDTKLSYLLYEAIWWMQNYILFIIFFTILFFSLYNIKKYLMIISFLNNYSYNKNNLFL
jgi:hypothetical protein